MKIFFAGAEQNIWTRALLREKVENILFSFFYIMTHHRELGIYDHITENPQVSWFLDSGAYTYGSAKKLKDNMLVPAEYMKLYFKYVGKYGHLFCRIAELDLDFSDQVSVEEISEWREEMLHRWPELPICPVWHTGRGIKEWEKYCADGRIRHLAIGSDVTDLGLLRRIVNMARVAGKTVHGFAMTKMKVNEVVRFDSVDSSGWSTGFRYGNLPVWQGNKFIVLSSDDKRTRRKYHKFYEAVGLDTKKIVSGDAEEIRRCTIISWRMLSERWEEKARRMEATLAEEGKPKWTTILERD